MHSDETLPDFFDNCGKVHFYARSKSEGERWHSMLRRLRRCLYLLRSDFSKIMNCGILATFIALMFYHRFQLILSPHP